MTGLILPRRHSPRTAPGLLVPAWQIGRPDRSPGGVHRWSVPPAAHANCYLGSVDLEAATGSSGDGLQVVWVRADHEVVAAYGSLDHAGVDDVGGGSAGGQRADRAGLA